MTEQDMVDLLAIYDAQEALQELVGALIGTQIGCGPGEGICGDLERVTGIISRHSALAKNAAASFEDTLLGQLLADREISTERKARIIIGTETP